MNCKTCNHEYSTHFHSEDIVRTPEGKVVYACDGLSTINGKKAQCVCKEFED